MAKNFKGNWATFEYLDDFCSAIQRIRQSGYEDVSTLSPCPRHEIDHALGEPQSRVPFFTLIFGLIGMTTAYVLTSWITLDWVLPVSSKPLVSIPPFTVIAFELTVLSGAYGTMIGVVLLIAFDTLRKSFPRSEAYKNYGRFTLDRFGLVVRCKTAEDQKKIEAILKNSLAEEIHHEG